LGLTKLAKNGLLTITSNIYSNCVVADHVAHSRFYVSNSTKNNRILLDQESDVAKGQSSPLIITQPGNCFRRYCIAGMGRSFILLLPPHVVLIDIVNTKVSLYSVVTYNSEVLSCVEISFNKVWTQNN
jgi:hypothetical protein